MIVVEMWQPHSVFCIFLKTHLLWEKKLKCASFLFCQWNSSYIPYYLAHDFIPATNTETTNSQKTCLKKALFCSDNQVLYYLFLFSNKKPFQNTL